MWYTYAKLSQHPGRRIAMPDGPDGIEPWQMTRGEFMDHHNTGHIRSDAYDNYATKEGLSWVRYEKYTEPYATLNLGGRAVEVRREREPLKYCKRGLVKYTSRDYFTGEVTEHEGEDILRDANGDCIYYTEDEMNAAGLPTESADLAAFHNKEAVGFASNEFGSTGVWVVEEFQHMGLGTYLLKEFRKLNPRLKKIGQMTNAGYNMTNAYHRSLVQDAVKAGHPVPEHVLQDYPDRESEIQEGDEPKV